MPLVFWPWWSWVFTSTWKEAVVVSPAMLVALQCTVVVPTGNTLPEAGEQPDVARPDGPVSPKVTV